MLEKLAQALKRRLQIIQDHQMRELNPSEHLVMLGNISEEIEQLTRALPVGSDPRLIHFLERASYSKALELLETKHRIH